MTPVEIVKAEGHGDVQVSDNKRGYVLVKYRYKNAHLLSSSDCWRGVIFKKNRKGWEKTRYEGHHGTMVTCFYNLTKN